MGAGMRQVNTTSATVQVWDGATLSWVDKKANKGESTFFPLSWSEQRIAYEVTEAFKGKAMIGGNQWEGVTPSGIKIRGYINPNRVTFFPVGS